MIVLVPAAIKAKGGVLSGGEWRLPCPVHGGSKGPLAITEKAGKTLFHCHAGCDSKEVLEALLREGLVVETDPKKTERKNERGEKPPFQPWMKRVWKETAPIKGTPAERYLRGRGLNLSREPALRYHNRRGEMVALVSGPPEKSGNAKATGLHLTKLPAKERKMHGRVKGGAVRLYRSNLPWLAVAEGIETALAWSEIAFQGRDYNLWACLSATGMQNLIVPKWVKSLTIIADMDGAGLTAAERLLKKTRESGVEHVRIVLPGGCEEYHKMDFADLAKKEG